MGKQIVSSGAGGTNVFGVVVTSFNGRTGAVMPQAGDYDISQITGNIVNTFNGRTGNVVPTSGDYTVAQITGAAPIASPTFTGVPAAPTAAPGTSTTQLATTAFVQAAIGLSSAWSALTNAVGNLALSNAGFSTTFNQTSAVIWTWANTTSATSSVSQSSPILTLSGRYWDGAASQVDAWTLQDVVANGTNGASTLTFAHSGSSGAAIVSVPILSLTPGLSSSTTPITTGIYPVTGNGNGFGTTVAMKFSANGSQSWTVGVTGSNSPLFASHSSGIIGWSASDPVRGSALDTGLSRISAGVLAIGNGAAADTSGTLQTAKVIGGASMRGTVSSGSGTTVSVTFGSAYGSTPVIVVTPTTNCGTFYISAQSASGFTITYATSGAQSFNWIAIG